VLLPWNGSRDTLTWRPTSAMIASSRATCRAKRPQSCSLQRTVSIVLTRPGPAEAGARSRHLGGDCFAAAIDL